nr:hypothetical protein CFP56_57962 [Quercus suber]
MSDDGQRSNINSDSADEGDDLKNNGLVATRAKRVNAGNLYATLRNNLDDADLQKELIDEEDDDAGDYEASDRDDDDAAMESSSDEEDAGPSREGEEDLEGEKVLKRIERQEARKKRKMKDAALRLPAWAVKKRVKLASSANPEEGEAKPKKKSERANWLPSTSDAPTRQSSRSLALANREIIHAHLQQSFQRSEKQRSIMKDAARREHTTKRADLTREQRLEKAARIAKETKREFGKWEREEMERQRVRDEILAAKRLRDIDGPFVRYWSGSGIWNGQKYVVTRNLPQKDREILSQVNKNELQDKSEKEKSVSKEGEEKTTDDQDKPDRILGTKQSAESPSVPSPQIAVDLGNMTIEHGASASKGQPLQDPAPTQTDLNILHEPSLSDISSVQVAPPNLDIPPMQDDQLSADISVIGVPSEDKSTSLLVATTDCTAPKIVDYINQPTPAIDITTTGPTPSLIMAQDSSNPSPGEPPLIAPSALSPIPHQYPIPGNFSNWPPGLQQSPAKTLPSPPPLPVVPIIREQAMRVCVMLEQYHELETHKKAKSSLTTEPTQTAKVLLPTSYPPCFTSEETKYLTTKHRKSKTGENLPVPPPKARCAITSWPAKYRDPKTGLAYFDFQMYKAIQRILAGGSMWSGLLGAWVGPSPGGISIGRAANGVPEGFNAPAPASAVPPGKVKEEEP